MILDVLQYPDKRLRKISKEVEVFDEDLNNLLDNMYETMMKKGGIGIAAIQVGVDKRVFLVNLLREDGIQHKEDLLEIINPVFLKKSGSFKWNEGCLSVPEFYEEVERFEEISLTYQDRFGQKKILQGKGLLAVAIQHETDHLNGVLFVDKLPILKRKKFDKELRKIQKVDK